MVTKTTKTFFFKCTDTSIYRSNFFQPFIWLVCCLLMLELEGSCMSTINVSFFSFNTQSYFIFLGLLVAKAACNCLVSRFEQSLVSRTHWTPHHNYVVFLFLLCILTKVHIMSFIYVSLFNHNHVVVY